MSVGYVQLQRRIDLVPRVHSSLGQHHKRGLWVLAKCDSFTLPYLLFEHAQSAHYQLSANQL